MLWIFDILVRIGISVPLTYGSGSGPAPDLDPALFVSVFQDANTKKFLFLKEGRHKTVSIKDFLTFTVINCNKFIP